MARECLIRVPYKSFSTIRSVSKHWRDELLSPEFHLLRRSSGLTRTVIALTQSGPNPLSATAKSAATPSYRLSLYDPLARAWDALPPLPAFPDGLPLFCQIAAAGRRLVVVGGWNPTNWVPSDSVFVFDFLSWAWRAGARMPGPRRSFFACASDGENTVFVAGGHDSDKNALRSALAYDVDADEWAGLPDMAAERDECKGVYWRGEFRVIGGYRTERQGRFERTEEAFDVEKRRWGVVVEGALDEGACPRTCMAGDDGRVYRCWGGKVVMRVRDGGCWGEVAEIPEEARVGTCAVAVKGRRVLVVGAAKHGGAHVGYLLDLERRRWAAAEAKEGFEGGAQVGCCLEI
ncbi:F-box/kelch-repeat protein [Acorus calamus]|uniref:F-box/kelch-repeat protein n=1 Tax=Acorus calamus TaxID=4465 RepID=A0AAV9C0Z2_ACOCL|nr:F-box/kelch-repeat protein [Acorus calamus]